MTAHPCGPALDDCRCLYSYPPQPRTTAAVAAAHREAVKRAKRSGWASTPFPLWLYELLDPTATRAGTEPWWVGRRAA
jgi:hypothetical protein